jgi:YggT family protein
MAEVVCTLLLLYLLVIFARIILSWFPIAYGSPLEGVASLLYAITEPLMGPLRRLIPPLRIGVMGIDLSPLILIVGIQILRGIIC